MYHRIKVYSWHLILFLRQIVARFILRNAMQDVKIDGQVADKENNDLHTLLARQSESIRRGRHVGREILKRESEPVLKICT